MSADNDSAHDAEPVRGNPVAALVIRARNGDERAWAALVEQYAPLIWSLCRRYRLDTTDTADAGQNVWLLLVHQLGKIRDPAALPAGSPPQPGGNANASLTKRRCRTLHGTSQTQTTSRTARPKRSSRCCWQPSDTRRYARRSRTCRPVTSS